MLDSQSSPWALVFFGVESASRGPARAALLLHELPYALICFMYLLEAMSAAYSPTAGVYLCKFLHSMAAARIYQVEVGVVGLSSRI